MSAKQPTSRPPGSQKPEPPPAPPGKRLPRFVELPTEDWIRINRERDELRAALGAIMAGQIGGEPDMDAERFRNAHALIARTRP